MNGERLPGTDDDPGVDAGLDSTVATPSHPEPSADAVEAVVRSINARDQGAAALPTPAKDPTRAERPTAGDRPSPIADASAAGSLRPGHPPAPWTGHRGAPIARSVPRGGIVGLVGRLEWERLVADEAERQRRYGRPSAIVLVELDGLDRAAAQTGAAVIGRVVSPCGEALVSVARASDRVTRLGDGRFGILLREADADGAARYASRAIATCDPWLATMPWPLRLVVGWAAPDGGEDLKGAMRQAEQRLLEASPPGTRAALVTPAPQPPR